MDDLYIMRPYIVPKIAQDAQKRGGGMRELSGPLLSDECSLSGPRLTLGLPFWCVATFIDLL